MQRQQKRRRKVLVASGGQGPEREVSLASGEAVTAGLLAKGYPAEQVVLESAPDLLERIDREDPEKPVIFVALHGAWGENGEFQSFLEMHNLPYTGSGPRGSLLAMEKHVSKLLFQRQDIPTPWWRECFRKQSPEALEELARRLETSPLVVKPDGCGSTVGISVVSSPEELWDAMEEAREYDSRIFVEEYIPGRELTVTVWEEKDRLSALPVVEICPKSGFYSYESKYTRGSTEYFAPADLETDMAEQIAGYAVAAHRAVGAQIYSRADFRLSPSGTPWILEVNTAPGMTATSLVPKAAAARGWDFPELVSRIVEVSLELRG